MRLNGSFSTPTFVSSMSEHHPMPRTRQRFAMAALALALSSLTGRAQAFLPVQARPTEVSTVVELTSKSDRPEAVLAALEGVVRQSFAQVWVLRPSEQHPVSPGAQPGARRAHACQANEHTVLARSDHRSLLGCVRLEGAAVHIALQSSGSASRDWADLVCGLPPSVPTDAERVLAGLAKAAKAAGWQQR